MREVAFIKQNKEKWLNFEKAIFGKTLKNPDELASLYIHLVNDLSYAQTYYPKSKTILYLNNLAAKAFQKIYKTKREDTNRFVHFWKIEVPLIVYQYRRYVLYAFLIFASFVAIGVLSSANDDGFTRLILTDGYVNQTKENIENGNPLAIYGTNTTWGTFLGILYHNLRVAINNYFWGIFGGIGSIIILMYNSIMVGTFQHMFYEFGTFWESVRGIWIHGTFEIFSMVIEAAAGLILGASILFPKTYSRLTSFINGFKDSFKIFLSTIPFTVVAAFLEGYVTRHYNTMPNWLSVGIILVTLFIISYYYLVYPYILNKKLKSTYGTI